MEDDSFVEFVDVRVQRGGAANVEVENFGARLVADGEEVAKTTGNEEGYLLSFDEK